MEVPAHLLQSSS